MTEPAGTAVCVLGPSRSGTSLTTRILDLAGVYLGPQEELLGKELKQVAGEGAAVLARARQANPEGFWEHYRLMRLNERILRRLGGSWRDPPAMPSGWEDSSDLAAERDEARELLAESFEGQPLWGWKDPRSCLTLPFWQRLVPEMRYVICLRNPADVAASLERRDEMPAEHAVRLWLIYVVRALVNTSGMSRLLVPYESHFDDPRATARRLAAFVDCDGAFDGAEAYRQLGAAIDEQMWRHRTTTSELASADHVPVEAVVLHLLTMSLAVTSGNWIGNGDLPRAIDLYAENLLTTSNVIRA